ncbi:MAG: alpha/beta hydrolase [Proteobacteria bacterium]|nr:alpha/beta hydrolase [Pseudomonadota bacterium]
MFDFDAAAIRERTNADPAFRLDARYWNARIGFELGAESYELRIRDGQVEEFARVASVSGDCDIRISGAAESWEKLLQAVPPPPYDDLFFGGAAVGFRVSGDVVDAVGPYYGALQDFVAVLRQARSGPAPARPVPDARRKFDSAVGRYLYLPVDGVEYRVYFEESGDGPVPLLLQHTAGADGRQWRHVLEDPDYRRLCRMLAYDLPYHGKSVPPTGVRWWESEYLLTRDFLMKTVVGIAHALELDDPVYMGCSIGGHLAPDLALYHPDEFAAVIGINAGLATPAARGNKTGESWYHPRVGSDWKASAMLGNTAPTSPEAYRRETGWVYSQGGPPVLTGDVFYYATDHDLTAEQARRIDTSKVAVHLLTGEYDPLAQPGGTDELARNIPGCEYHLIPGMGHFGPSENPEDFKPYLLPILEKLAAARPRASGG